MKMTKLNLFSLLAFFAIGLVFAGCTQDNSQITTEKPAIAADAKNLRGTKLGQHAPDFELTRVNGEQVSLASLEGKPAVLVFWSYYCPNCEEEAPHINKLNEQFAPKGVQVLGINIGESKARTMGGIRDFGIKYGVARDEGAKITRLYGVRGTPTVIFLDKNGRVAYNGNKLPDGYAEILNRII
jgi:peroxiredoxin